jgi:hypothetical protein
MKPEILSKVVMGATLLALFWLALGWSARMIWFFLILGWRLGDLMAPL